MESHRFIVVPLCKMGKIKEKKRHGDVPGHRKVDDYIFRGSNSFSSFFTFLFDSIPRVSSML